MFWLDFVFCFKPISVIKVVDVCIIICTMIKSVLVECSTTLYLYDTYKL